MSSIIKGINPQGLVQPVSLDEDGRILTNDRADVDNGVSDVFTTNQELDSDFAVKTYLDLSDTVPAPVISGVAGSGGIHINKYLPATPTGATDPVVLTPPGAPFDANTCGAVVFDLPPNNSSGYVLGDHSKVFNLANNYQWIDTYTGNNNKRRPYIKANIQIKNGNLNTPSEMTNQRLVGFKATQPMRLKLNGYSTNAMAICMPNNLSNELKEDITASLCLYVAPIFSNTPINLNGFIQKAASEQHKLIDWSNLTSLDLTTPPNEALRANLQGVENIANSFVGTINFYCPTKYWKLALFSKGDTAQSSTTALIAKKVLLQSQVYESYVPFSLC